MLRKIFLISFVFLLLASASVFYLGKQWLNQPIGFPEQGFNYFVEPGSSLTSTTLNFNAQGYIDFPLLLARYARIVDKTDIRAGEYRFSQDDTPLSFLEKLVRGDVVEYQVTLVEGWTFKQALKHLHTQEKLVIKLIDENALNDFYTSLALEKGHPEGWFFPDTYQYIAGMSDLQILEQAHLRMRDVLATEWANRLGELPYKSSYEALIMASIVERETGVPSEREQIAGVFVRRLENNMRLQTDPTVIYGLGDQFSGNIRRQHLTQATPYNTYVIKGLPPTPIALPGKESIYAALHPDNGNALYFVAKGDGSHQFSSTLEEHNRAVREFQILRRAKNYQSRPENN
ncbi:endolytic transglycosylase MltG [Aurantivibrio infirmus]